MALFISLEGGDGAGKTALATELSERLQPWGAELVATFEPGATPLGATLRERLFRADAPLTPWTETFLFLADRAQHVAAVIRPALARGALVICDRYTDSTLAYQGYGRGLDLDLIRTLNHHATDGLHPHLTLFLDLPVSAGLARSRPQRVDRIGREPVDFHRRVLEGYHRIALAEPERVQTLDAARPLPEVAAAAWALLEPRLQGSGFRPPAEEPRPPAP